MRIMIDTNIFISAVLFPKGRAAEALYKAMVSPYQPVVCDYVIDELHRKFKEKFPERTTELEAFLYTALPAFEIVTTPVEAIEAESKIRDPKDSPILRAALNAGADLFLTGDEEAARVFDTLGIDTSTAVRMFLKRAVMENGIPFRMTLPRELYSADRGFRAMQEINESAQKNGTSDLTLDEINAEIDTVRTEPRPKAG